MGSASAAVKLVTVLSLSVAACPLRAQEDDPVVRRQFMEGVAQAGRKLDQLSFRAKCVHTSRLTAVSAKLRAKYAERNANPDEMDTTKFEVAVRGPLHGLETGIRRRSELVYFKVRNDSYAFALARTAEGERTNMDFVEQLGVDPAIDARIAEAETTPRGIALSAYYLWASYPLFDMVKSDSFNVMRSHAITSGGKELVRVEFEYGGEDIRYTNGFLVCDPAREWGLTEYGGTSYNEKNKETRIKRAVLEYGGETVDGIPIPTKTVWNSYSAADPETKSESVATVEITDDDVPKSEFYLSHYGLPEPKFGRTWFGRWLWYLIAGIACLGIGTIIFKWRKTRR